MDKFLELISTIISANISFLFLLFLVYIVFFGLVFLAIRPIVTWYFKISKINNKLEKNNELLSDILEELEKINENKTQFGKNKNESENSYQKDYSRYMPK